MIKRKENKKKRMERQRWKHIVRRYPFLAARTDWYSGKILTKEEKKGIQPWLMFNGGDLPNGWIKRFVPEMCEDLREEYKRCGCLNTAYVEAAKEKFGSMNLYMGGETMNCRSNEIIDKYEQISETVCAYCGKMDTPMINMYGWILPVCEDCFNKRDKYISVKEHKHYRKLMMYKDAESKTPEQYEYTVYGESGEKHIVDMKNEVKRIRSRSGKRNWKMCNEASLG